MPNKNEYGVWMDTQNAVIVGTDENNEDNMVVIAHITGEGISQNSSEKNSNNQEKTLQA